MWRGRKVGETALARQEPPPGLERHIRTKLADWRGLLTRDVASGRNVIRQLLVGPLRFTPILEERRRRYAFAGRSRWTA